MAEYIASDCFVDQHEHEGDFFVSKPDNGRALDGREAWVNLSDKRLKYNTNPEGSDSYNIPLEVFKQFYSDYHNHCCITRAGSLGRVTGGPINYTYLAAEPYSQPGSPWPFLINIGHITYIEDREAYLRRRLLEKRFDTLEDQRQHVLQYGSLSNLDAKLYSWD